MLRARRAWRSRIPGVLSIAGVPWASVSHDGLVIMHGENEMPGAEFRNCYNRHWPLKKAGVIVACITSLDLC